MPDYKSCIIFNTNVMFNILAYEKVCRWYACNKRYRVYYIFETYMRN